MALLLRRSYQSKRRQVPYSCKFADRCFYPHDTCAAFPSFSHPAIPFGEEMIFSNAGAQSGRWRTASS